MTEGHACLSTAIDGPPCRPDNPFEDSDISCYLGYDGLSLRRLRHDGPVQTDWEHIHHVFRATIESPSYPCAGAKASVRGFSYRMGFYGSIRDSQNGLSHDLFEFAAEQPTFRSFGTFVAAFERPPFPADIDDFHESLFLQLQQLADVDVDEWDPRVSSDPQNPGFEFSFAGRAWFVIGLTPNAPRVARRFLCPLLVFNAHDQFEDLRAAGRYDAMKASVARRDARLQPDGTINPLLANSGHAPAWIQFSGKEVLPSEMCPLRTEKS